MSDTARAVREALVESFFFSTHSTMMLSTLPTVPNTTRTGQGEEWEEKHTKF